MVGVQAAQASEEELAAIKAAQVEHPVVVLRDQSLSEDEQVAFGARFGPLDTNPLAGKSYNAGLREDLLNVANVDEGLTPAAPTDRRRLLDLGNKLWHTDSSFKPVPAHLSMLYGVRVAEQGGETEFADLRAAYDALSDDWRAMIAGLVAAHSPTHSRDMLGFDAWHPEHREKHGTVAYDLVRVLPESGRTSLYLSAHASHVIGMPIPVGRMLLHELTELATAREHVYAHRWRTRDLVIWDNRCTMHRMRRYKASSEVRVLRRVTTLDTAFPARDPAGVSVPDQVVNDAA
jgi:alpha-ketoglutarate-dependent 2,4-dichlorophenoxyacetate dioxygenase